MSRRRRPPKPHKNNKRLRACFHEAGHVLLLLHHGFGFEYVSHTPGASTSGRVDGAPAPDWGEPQWVEVAMAGGIAEFAMSGVDSVRNGIVDDQEKVQRHVSAATVSVESCVSNATSTILERWDDVCRIAALICGAGRVSAEAIQQALISGQALDDYHRHAPSVEDSEVISRLVGWFSS